MLEVGQEWILHTSPFRLKETTTPPNAQVPANTLALYAKDNGSGISQLCYKNDAFNEVCLPTSGSIVTGTGVANRLAYWTSTSAIDDVPRTFTAGSVLFAHSDFLPQEDNANFFWEDTNNILALGSAGSVHGSTTNTRMSLERDATNILEINSHVVGGTTFAGIDFYKSLGTHAAPSVLGNNDFVGSLRGKCYDGNSYEDVARILFTTGTTGPADGATPGTILFQITPPASVTPTERFRMGQSGEFGIGGANFGTSGQVFTSGGTGAAPSWATVAALAFKTIAVSGQSDVVADAADDTLTLAAGSGITITTNAGTDTITITGSGTTNALLDGSNHTDTVAQTVSRGSLIYGNSTPKWDELVVGSAGAFLRNDGTDAMWSTLILPNAATSTRLVYATAANTYGESADLTYDGTDLAISSGKRFRMQSQNRIRYLNSMVLAVETSNQSIPNSTWTQVTYNDADTVDTDGLHDTASNTGRLTAALAGKYYAYFVGYMPDIATGVGGFAILKNAADSFSAAAIRGFCQAVSASSFTANCFVELTVGDELESWVFQSSGGSINLTNATIPARFGMVYLGE